MGIPILPPDSNFGASLGAAIGQGFGGGFSEGLSTRLNQMLEQKQNLQTANGLADYMGLQGDKRSNFLNAFGNIPSKDQVGALQKMAEAQALQQYYQSQMSDLLGGLGMVGGEDVSMNEMSMQDRLGQPPEIEESEVNVQQPEPQQRSKPKIAGFEFEPNELDVLKRKTAPPAIGGLTQQAKLEADQLRENRAEIGKYAKDYEDVSELQKNLNDLKEAQRIIHKMNPSFVRKLAVSILDDNESSVSNLIKTADEQRLFSLLRQALRPKDIGGSNPSTREVLIAMNSIPNITNKKEANEYIIKNMIANAEKNLDKGRLIQGIRSKNPSADPERFKEIVETKISEKYGQGPFEAEETVTVQLPDGRTGQIPKSNLQEALKRGAKQVQ